MASRLPHFSHFTLLPNKYLAHTSMLNANLLHSCLRNVVSMLHILEREMEWRKKQGRPEGFETLRTHKPVIAVGAQQPLDDQKMLADYFRMYCLTLLIRSAWSILTLIVIRWKGWSRRHSFHRESHSPELYTHLMLSLASPSHAGRILGTSF